MSMQQSIKGHKLERRSNSVWKSEHTMRS